jgi:hypothetical protein
VTSLIFLVTDRTEFSRSPLAHAARFCLRHKGTRPVHNVLPRAGQSQGTPIVFVTPPYGGHVVR